MTRKHQAKHGGAINLIGVNHTYTGVQGPVEALRDVYLDVAQEQFVALVGPSGCGKTTILHMMAGLLTPAKGRVEVMKNGVPAALDSMGYMLARDALLPWRTAKDNVKFSLQASSTQGGGRAIDDIAQSLLDRVGLSDFHDVYPTQLSQGMRQRVAIARTLAPEPSILLMDEPFAALDAQTRLHIQAMFMELWEASRSTVVLITHDLQEAILLADRVAIMSARPGTVKETVSIKLTRPRNLEKLLETAEFHDIYARLWHSLSEEFSVPKGS